MARTVTIPYAPRGAFKAFHGRQQRWSCIVAHRRAGKTVACINDLIRRAVTDGKENGRYAYIAPFLNQAKAVAWDYLIRYTQPIRTNQNASEMWVELPNMARIRLFGADHEDAMRGLFFDGIIADEYGDWKPSVWGNVIRPALADRKGWATIIGTPKGHNAFYDIWKAAKQDQGWYIATLPASATAILDADELRAARSMMSDDQYQQEFECSFDAAIMGAFYGKEFGQAEREGRITEVMVDAAVPIHTAWDLGYRDDTAIWFYQVVRGEVHIIDFYASSGDTIEHYAKILKEKEYNYGLHWLPHDARAKTLASGGKSIIEQMAEHLGYASLRIVPNLDLQDGIQAARVMMDRAWFDATRCEAGIEALKQYQREYDEDKKAFRKIPRHDWTSHAADAFRMLAVAWSDEAPRDDKPKAQPILAVGEISTYTMDDAWRDAPRPSARI